MTRILGVHGIGNLDRHRPAELAAERLTSTWRTQLAGGGVLAEPAAVRVAYWAPNLHRRHRQGPDTDPTTLSMGELDVLAALVADIDTVHVSQGRLTLPLRQAIALLAARRGVAESMMSAFVAVFCREVHAYLQRPNSPGRAATRATVIDALVEHQPDVVIAHSLGSVIAYEALWAMPDIDVDLLITLGSPLGLPNIIFERLLPAPRLGRAHRPPGVRRWVNIADPGDIVAIPRWLARKFDGVNADIEASIHRLDFHRAAAYLRLPNVAAAIAELT
ncbi:MULTISPECIES: serine peptidase [unclassified Crossiella]|uniref:serine peptidase n=1 Tax=unclassified Crossiella TaxID=2620835 RepID=UPI001FFEA89D|nr:MULTISPECIES: serine peptidase [unclassified Crossiella]MCK2240899.1 serine peptidase [Crossiella sp. S99.2]MCK2253957.1 serine peptidase [Crossiella sp. S99.1]